MKNQLGLVSVSFRKNSPEDILAAMKSAGLTCIEWGSDVHAPCDDLENLKKIVELQNKYGITCCSYGTYFRFGLSGISELEGYIKAAKILGTNILRLWCGKKGSAEYTEEEKAKLFADCRAAAKIAAENGVILCMECHGGTYTDTLASAKELMSEVGCESFKMYWQPNQYRSEEENLEYAEWVAPYCTNVHVFNWRERQHLKLELAIDTWKSYLEKLGDGRNLLLEFMPDGKMESLGNEVAALKVIAGEK